MNHSLLLWTIGGCFFAPVPADPGPAPRMLAVSGRVVHAHGQPVVGAQVYLRDPTALRKPRPQPGPAPKEILAKTTTDVTGSFAFRRVLVRKPSPEEQAGKSPDPWDLVVIAKGHAIAWQPWSAGLVRRPITVTLPPAAALEGRVRDGASQPVAGATITVLRLQGLDQPAQGTATTPGNLDLEGSQISVTTVSDSDGRFVLKDLPPNIRATLVVSEPRFGRRLVYAATTNQPQPKLVVRRSRAPDGTVRTQEEPVHTGAFTVALEPGHRLRVRVVGQDTGKPLAGARLRQLLGPTPLLEDAVTDAQGEFTLPQLQAGRYRLSLAAPEGTDYLGLTAPVELPAEKADLGVVFPLPVGTAVTGQVIEAESGNGIPDVPIAYQSVAAGNQAFATPVRSGADGRFRMVVSPGKGWLRIAAEVPGYVLTDLFPSPKREAEGRLVQRIDVTPGLERSGVKFTLSRGLVVHLRILDPDGKPVQGVQVSGVSTDADGRATVSGLEPGKRQDLFLTHLNRRLATRVGVTPPKPGESLNLEVKLQPTAAVTGRVVDEDHKPLPEATVQLLRLAPGTDEKITFYSTAQAVPITVGPDGRFTLEDLVPDTQHNVTVSAPGYASAFGAPFDTQAGQTHPLPDIVLPKADQVIAGVVVDPLGRPVADVQVFGTPVRWGGIQQSVRINSGQVRTDAAGRFRLTGVPRGLVRLSTYLPPPPSSRDRTIRTSTSLQVEAGRQDVRVILSGPQTDHPVEAVAGKAAPAFAVRQWQNAPAAISERSFRPQDFQGKVVLLAFMDEAKPSQRLLARLNALQERLAGKGLVVVQVCESAEEAARSPDRATTPLAEVAPGLLPGGYSEAFQKYGVRAAPTLFLIDRRGVLRQADVELDALAGFLDELLKP